MVNKCQFCGKLFEHEVLASNACPDCVIEARNNFPPKGEKRKKFLESDGFFDKDEYLSEEKSSGFFESSNYNLPRR
jgi:hypothetical protein